MTGTPVLLYTGNQRIPFCDKLWFAPLPVLWSE